MGFISAVPNLAFIALGKMSAESVQDPSRETFATTFITRCALPPKWTTSPTVSPVLVVYPHPHSAVPNAAGHIVTDDPLVFMSVVVSRSSELPSGSLSAPVADPTLFAGASVTFRSSNGRSGRTTTGFQSHASGNGVWAQAPCTPSDSTFDSSDFSAMQTFEVEFRPSLTGLQTRPSPVPLLTPIVGAVLTSVVF